ncbi:MAG TPA: EamA family transporter RarD [Opitutaceae bacterium]|nr:EamA family transporter RarD [Opitutaceae bacterium]
MRGLLAAFGCYFTWGLVPLFWKQLAAVDAFELIAQRLVWSCVLLAPLLAWRGGWGEARSALGTPGGFAVNFFSSVLLTINWLVYVWAVNAGQVIECSLGYFLVPLINVALGKLVLHERLRRAQWLAIGLAAVGVVLLLVRLGKLPWVALALAATFGTYGLLRKQSPLGPLTGLAVETSLLAPFALVFLLWRAQQGAGALGHAPVGTQLLISTTGVVTAVPLLLFAYGARRLKLTTLGLLQYVAPTVQFAIAVLVYHEAFSHERAQSFALIWTGLAIYTVDALWQGRRTAAA